MSTDTAKTKKGISLFDKKFWVNGDDNESATANETSTPSGAPQRMDNYSTISTPANSAQNYGSFSQPSSGVGTLRPEIKEDLQKVLNDHNFPGEDYLELREAIVNMMNAGLDSTTALKGAYATLKTRGLSKEKAIDTANQYIGILNQEKEKFYVALNDQKSKRVTAPEQEINSLNQENVQLAKQIEDITTKMNTNNDSISKKKVEIAEGNSVLDRTRLDYEFTHSTCVKDIQDDIVKIQTLIS